YTSLYNEKTTDQKISEMYWDATLDSGMFNKIKPYLNELTGGLPKNEVYKIIDKSEISDEGLQFAVYLELSFSKNNKIYLELGSDMPSIIDKIWLKDGTLLGSKVRNESPVQKFLLVGILNDKYSYANVRVAPSNEAKVIDKIINKELFYYVPNSNSDWLQVSRKDDIKATIGYVHNSQILKYSAMPNEIQKKVVKERNSD
ncbi:MAG: SH3 domain-containing protein, partial [Bacteroidota bacterium]